MCSPAVGEPGPSRERTFWRADIVARRGVRSESQWHREDKHVGDARGQGVPGNRAIGWAIWLLAGVMALALLFFVYRHGDNVPYFDDWRIVPVLTGHEPITLRWLWSQHNEHRMPIQKL